MEVKDLEKGLQLARTFFLLNLPSLPPGTDCEGRGMRADLQEGQVAREEPKATPDSAGPQTPLVCAPSSPDYPRSSGPFSGPYPPSESLLSPPHVNL